MPLNPSVAMENRLIANYSDNEFKKLKTKQFKTDNRLYPFPSSSLSALNRRTVPFEGFLDFAG
jgi:hypothetical protein